MSAIDVLVNTRVSAEHADTFQRLETAAQQIESQMKDLTDYAHLDSGMMELRIVPFDAQKLIAETANEIATLTRKEQVKLSCEVECSHLLVHSDPLRIRQIIVNLLTNAYKYTESGSITLHSCLRRQPGGSSLIIEVTDTGIGIEKDQLDQIFKPFTQLDQSHTKRYAGVGMGLAIVHGPVTLLDGTITVYSEIKKGSTFIVSIPVQISEDERADEPAAANASLQQKPQQVPWWMTTSRWVTPLRRYWTSWAISTNCATRRSARCRSCSDALTTRCCWICRCRASTGPPGRAAAQPSRPQPPCADHRHQRLHAGAADGGPARPVRQLPDEAGPAGCAVERAGRGVPRQRLKQRCSAASITWSRTGFHKGRARRTRASPERFPTRVGRSPARRSAPVPAHPLSEARMVAIQRSAVSSPISQSTT